MAPAYAPSPSPAIVPIDGGGLLADRSLSAGGRSTMSHAAPTGPSLTGRALLALALMVGFYVLALGIAAGLLWIPYMEVMTLHRFYVKPTLFCLIGAGTILWSILPRLDKFQAPGPQLLPDAQPRLFQEL